MSIIYLFTKVGFIDYVQEQLASQQGTTAPAPSTSGTAAAGPSTSGAASGAATSAAPAGAAASGRPAINNSHVQQVHVNSLSFLHMDIVSDLS